MRQKSLIILAILTLTAFVDRDILIDETGFDNIRIGKTTISEIKRRHLFSKRSKTWRHALYRTEEGRIGVMYDYEQIHTRQGITYFFNYERGTKDPVTIDEILFAAPANVRTNRGIELGQSTFKQVADIYGAERTSLEHGKLVKAYDAIEFYSDRLIGSDSVDSGYIVTGIRIKGE
jgi:hypothetical protein